MWPLDFSNAYKTIGLTKASDDAAHVCFINPVGKRPYKARALVHPLGSRMAPENWGRVVTFFQFVDAELLQVTTGDFADGVLCVESHRLAMSGFWAFKKLCQVVGLPTSDKKDQPPSTVVVLLGADVSLHETHVQAQVREDRKQRLKEQISVALKTNVLTPAGAIKLRGELGFYTPLLVGKLGRGMMGPLISRQYRHHGTHLGPELKRNLIWRYSALGNLAPRTAPFQQLRPVGAHTDAQGFGHVAALFYGESRHEAHTHLPEWFCKLAESSENESPIFIYELCASILTVYTAIGWRGEQPRTCVLCVDNKAAVAALVKGISPSNLAGVLVNLFWTVAARGNTRWWIEYFNTKSNAAGRPSRLCALPLGTTCNATNGHVPAGFRTAFATWENLHIDASAFEDKKGNFN